MKPSSRHPLFTIGHSNHPLEHFRELLRRHGVETVADVRSLSDNQLIGVLQAVRRQENREAWKKALVIAEFARRVENSPKEELQTCINQIHRIAQFRLDDLVSA